VLESTKAELQKVNRDLQEQQVSELKSLQKALNYKHLYEQLLQQQNEQLKEMKKCMEDSYQLLQHEYARLNEMTLLQKENIALMEELTKCRGHVNQLL
jgi:hypothetical protein